MTKREAIAVYTAAAEKLWGYDGNLSSLEYNTLTLAMYAAGAILQNKINPDDV
jgi:hypothetical protein